MVQESDIIIGQILGVMLTPQLRQYSNVIPGYQCFVDVVRFVAQLSRYWVLGQEQQRR